MSSKWFEENIHPISPCVAQIKCSQSYPKLQNKTHTADLSRLVSAEKELAQNSKEFWVSFFSKKYERL